MKIFKESVIKEKNAEKIYENFQINLPQHCIPPSIQCKFIPRSLTITKCSSWSSETKEPLLMGLTSNRSSIKKLQGRFCRKASSTHLHQWTALPRTNTRNPKLQTRRSDGGLSIRPTYQSSPTLEKGASKQYMQTLTTQWSSILLLATRTNDGYDQSIV